MSSSAGSATSAVARCRTRGRALATATARPRSRPRRGRSHWSGRSCATPTRKFVSRLFGTGVSKTNALETLVIAGFVRGLSARDVGAALADALGPQAALSKSTVSRVCQAIRDEFDT